MTHPLVRIYGPAVYLALVFDEVPVLCVRGPGDSDDPSHWHCVETLRDRIEDDTIVLDFDDSTPRAEYKADALVEFALASG